MGWNIIKGHGGRTRSFAKAVSWRVVGTIDTFIWSLIISHQAFQASSIASTEIITKVPLFYLHERVWRLVTWAPDSHLRSLLKAISWRFIGGLDTFLRSWLFTGKIEQAASITTAETVTKIALFYLHERAWRTVRWGRLEAEPQAVVAAVVQGEAVS